ncbi:hypothetical protein [Campylobacter hyointestinalis]|uniref:hypothetical protein n=1 Tax=Campylobacter hyointestinalis TaxID=198 RepID=UPI000DCD5E33|nr:hypothetical protein [Campylobacter hyointestinalis]RAZ37948.1 hypothetical protein CHL9426_07250 [Campylobacter hyointestinalis subsp. lawsonii]
MPKNFGLPPYHFRCRTEIVPVWIDEEEIEGVVMRNTSPLNKDEDLSYKKLNEICDFEVVSNGYKFTGTFIDALEYIKANFKV